MSWTFAGVTLEVMHEPRPVSISGYRKITFQPPGYDGLAASLDDGRFPAQYSLTVQALTYDDYQTLRALFDSGASGDFEVPHDGDWWVFANAFIAQPVTWTYAAYERIWRAAIEVMCPDPRPRWKSTAERVY